MNKQVDMQAFVGVDFDCEFFNSPDEDEIELGQKLGGQVIISPLLKVGVFDDGMPNDYWYQYDADGFRLWKDRCRPRIGKPQVIKGGQISWIPDGLVWNAFGENPNYNGGDSEFFNLDQVSSQELRDVFAGYATWIECIGAEPDYTCWANAHGVPVVEVSK